MKKTCFSFRRVAVYLLFSQVLCLSFLWGQGAGLSIESLPVVDRDNGFRLEAEHGMLSSGGQVADDVSASGGKLVVPKSGSGVQTQFLEFGFRGRKRKHLEMYLRLKVEGAGKVRFYYEVDRKNRYPMDVSSGRGWQMCQVARLFSYKTEPHSLRLFCDDPRLKIDSLHFEDCATDELPAGNSLRILPPVKRKSRIVVRDINYVPEAVGEAMVCLWKHDAIGCATYTIDDNHAEEIDWWLETAKKYKVRLTWFIICHRIGKGHPVAGSWDDFRRVLAEGHDVQSHSFSHLNDLELTIDEEYSKAVEAIEKNLPGHKIEAVAYPGGRYMGKNLPDVSQRYHIASRGVVGLVNVAGKTDYMCTNSFGSQNMDPNNWSGLPNMVKRNPRWRNNYRAWHCHHFHNVRGDFRKKVSEAMAFYQQNKVWLPSFVEAVKYGQERDSATLKTVQNKADELVLSLKDKMDDTIYDYPLTLRVHVADDWTSATAEQNGTLQQLKAIDIDGKRTLMFEAVPDRGEITVRKVN